MRTSAGSAERGGKVEDTEALMTADIMTVRTVTAKGPTSRGSGAEVRVFSFFFFFFQGCFVRLCGCECYQSTCPCVDWLSLKIKTYNFFCLP